MTPTIHTPALLLTFFVPLLAVLAVSLRAIALARRWGLVDHPDSRKNHLHPTPLAGGLLLFPVAVAGFTAAFWNDVRLPSLLAGLVIVFVLGIWDDRNGVHFSTKFLAQIIAALFVIQGGFIVDLNQVGLLEPLGMKFSGLLSTLVTLCWIVGITNAVNLIDGMDGLAAGLCLNALVGMTALALVGHQPRVAVASLTLMGGILGFLRFNLPPARAFLGDSGSLLLGFCLSVLAIHQSAKSSTFVVLVIPVLFVAIPMTDTAMAFSRRILDGRNPFRADRGHIHHILLDMDFSPLQTLGYFYTFSAVLGGLGLWLAQYGKAHILALALLVTVAMVAGVRALQVVNIRSAVSRLNRKMRLIGRRGAVSLQGPSGRNRRMAIILSFAAAGVAVMSLTGARGSHALLAATVLIWVVGMADLALLSREIPPRGASLMNAGLLVSILLAQLAFHRPADPGPAGLTPLVLASCVLLVLACAIVISSRALVYLLDQPMEILSLYMAAAVAAVFKHYAGIDSLLPLAMALVNTFTLYITAKALLARPVTRAAAAGISAATVILILAPWL